MRLLATRLAGAAALFWIVLTITFLLVRLAPGDPAELLIPPSATAIDALRVRAELGLDDPLAVQYARWAHGVLTGDLGESFVFRRPVWRVLAEALPLSLALGMVSLGLTFLFGIATGAVQAIFRGTRLDTGLTMLTTAVYSAPSFWLALALVAVFTYGAARWGFPLSIRLPAFGVRDPASDATGVAALVDVARHAVLPITTLTLIGAAGIARYSRSIFADLVSADFVRTARSKGARRRTVYGRHVIANAWPPIIVLFSLALPGVIAGSVFVETVFALPGMGRLLVGAISGRDYPLVLGATTFYAALVILANLAGELALPLVDPRRRR